MASATSVIVKDPQILHGTPVFRGTRVPVKALCDSLEAGETLEEFLARISIRDPRNGDLGAGRGARASLRQILNADSAR